MSTLELPADQLNYSHLQQFSQRAAFSCALGFAFFIPISPALMNIFLFFTLVFTLLSGNLRNHLQTAWDNPVSRAGILLFLLFVLGTTWSDVGWSESFRTLKKYNELWYIALLLPLFSSSQKRTQGINTFLASMTLILAVVYSLYFQIISELQFAVSENSTTYITVDGGFRSHIITNILMSFAVYIFAQRTLLETQQKRWLYATLFLFATYYALFISTGTTGQILTIGLLSLLIIQHFRLRSFFLIPLLFIAIFAYGYSNENTSINHAVSKIVDGVDHYKKGNTKVATAKRLEFYSNSMVLIEEHPLIGTGTGSFEQRYFALPNRYIGSNPTTNPHNEYLMTTVQLGVIGLLGLLFLFATQGQQSFQIATLENRFLAQGLVALIVVGCMGNSLILDSGEGHFWAFFSALLFSALPEKQPIMPST